MHSCRTARTSAQVSMPRRVAMTSGACVPQGDRETTRMLLGRCKELSRACMMLLGAVWEVLCWRKGKAIASAVFDTGFRFFMTAAKKVEEVLLFRVKVALSFVGDSA